MCFGSSIEALQFFSYLFGFHFICKATHVIHYILAIFCVLSLTVTEELAPARCCVAIIILTVGVWENLLEFLVALAFKSYTCVHDECQHNYGL